VLEANRQYSNGPLQVGSTRVRPVNHQTDQPEAEEDDPLKHIRGDGTRLAAKRPGMTLVETARAAGSDKRRIRFIHVSGFVPTENRRCALDLDRSGPRTVNRHRRSLGNERPGSGQRPRLTEQTGGAVVFSFRTAVAWLCSAPSRQLAFANGTLGGKYVGDRGTQPRAA